MVMETICSIARHELNQKHPAQQAKVVLDLSANNKTPVSPAAVDDGPPLDAIIKALAEVGDNFEAATKTINDLVVTNKETLQQIKIQLQPPKPKPKKKAAK